MTANDPYISTRTMVLQDLQLNYLAETHGPVAFEVAYNSQSRKHKSYKTLLRQGYSKDEAVLLLAGYYIYENLHDDNLPVCMAIAERYLELLATQDNTLFNEV